MAHLNALKLQLQTVLEIIRTLVQIFRSDSRSNVSATVDTEGTWERRPDPFPCRNDHAAVRSSRVTPHSVVHSLFAPPQQIASDAFIFRVLARVFPAMLLVTRRTTH